MDQIVSTQEIQDTEAYKRLEPVFQNMILKLPNKKTISYGLTIHKNTGVIPGSVAGNNLKVLLDLISSKKD